MAPLRRSRGPRALAPLALGLLTTSACAPASTRGGETASATPPSATSIAPAPSTAPTPSAAPAPHPSATPSASASATPFSCAKDDDCTNSCTHGAVGRAWWEKSYPGGEGCEDGCTSKGTDPPRCEQGECVAYFQAKRSAGCTHRERPVPPGPGPAHRCTTAADCMTSCRYGAVNEAWYAYGAKDECKDGCAELGNDLRCEAGACILYSGTERAEGCTLRSIHTP